MIKRFSIGLAIGILSLAILLLFGKSAQVKKTEHYVVTYSSPEKAGVNGRKLSEIDNVVKKAIAHGVTPGAVVLVAKDGKIIKESAYGYAYKYDMGQLLSRPRKMTANTMFDLASITKVMGTTQGIMKLVDEGKLSVQDRVVKYLPEFRKNGKGHITIADLLTHTSGLASWEPSYLVAANPKEMLDYIDHMKLNYKTGSKRVYSDFNFITLQFIIEKITKQPLDVYLEKEFYKPLHMTDTMFKPGKKLKNRVAATSWGNPEEYNAMSKEKAESFKKWRHYTLVGEVNDGICYYSNGGVCGNAGLFSTAKDLSILGQAMLNGGTYGKTRLYNEKTLREFTSEHRFGQGYGWERNKNWYMGTLHSDSTFGHTGSTGTQMIIDPENNLQIYVLTNKQNNGLKKDGYPNTGVLTKQIATIVYKAME